MKEGHEKLRKQFEDLGYSTKEGTEREVMTNLLKRAYDEGQITPGDFDSYCSVLEQDPGEDENGKILRAGDLEMLKLYALQSLNEDDKFEEESIVDMIHNNVEGLREIYNKVDIEETLELDNVLYVVLENTEIMYKVIDDNLEYLHDIDDEDMISLAKMICHLLKTYRYFGLDYVNKETSPVTRLAKAAITLFDIVLPTDEANKYIHRVEEELEKYYYHE